MYKPDSSNNRRIIKCLEYVNNYFAINKAQPSLRKIQKHMGYKSVRSAQDLVAELVARKVLKKGVDGALYTTKLAGEISDGYHTFNELYEHRIVLWIALCKCYKERVWRSKLHSDGSGYEGYFVLGMNKEKGQQITYHLPLSKWKETNFAETLQNAPEYDGHKSKTDVLARIKNLTTTTKL